MEPIKIINMEFQKRLTSLIKSENQYVKQGLKASSEIKSENGAKKHSTTGNKFVDNFASASNFKNPRSYEEVSFVEFTNH